MNDEMEFEVSKPYEDSCCAIQTLFVMNSSKVGTISVPISVSLSPA